MTPGEATDDRKRLELIEAAGQRAVAEEQWWYLIDHGHDEPVENCPGCVRLAAVILLLMAPFSYKERKYGTDTNRR